MTSTAPTSSSIPTSSSNVASTSSVPCMEAVPCMLRNPDGGTSMVGLLIRPAPIGKTGSVATTSPTLKQFGNGPKMILPASSDASSTSYTRTSQLAPLRPKTAVVSSCTTTATTTSPGSMSLVPTSSSSACQPIPIAPNATSSSYGCMPSSSTHHQPILPYPPNKSQQNSASTTNFHHHPSTSSTHSNSDLMPLLDDIPQSDLVRLLNESESLLSDLNTENNSANGGQSDGSSIQVMDASTSYAPPSNMTGYNVTTANYPSGSGYQSGLQSQVSQQSSVAASMPSTSWDSHHQRSSCQYSQASTSATVSSQPWAAPTPRLHPMLDWEQPANDSSGTPDSGVHSIAGSPQLYTPPMISPHQAGANRSYTQPQRRQHAVRPVPGYVGEETSSRSAAIASQPQVGSPPVYNHPQQQRVCNNYTAGTPPSQPSIPPDERPTSSSSSATRPGDEAEEQVQPRPRRKKRLHKRKKRVRPGTFSDMPTLTPAIGDAKRSASHPKVTQTTAAAADGQSTSTSNDTSPVEDERFNNVFEAVVHDQKLAENANTPKTNNNIEHSPSDVSVAEAICSPTPSSVSASVSVVELADKLIVEKDPSKMADSLMRNLDPRQLKELRRLLGANVNVTSNNKTKEQSPSSEDLKNDNNEQIEEMSPQTAVDDEEQQLDEAEEDLPQETEPEPEPESKRARLSLKERQMLAKLHRYRMSVRAPIATTSTSDINRLTMKLEKLEVSPPHDLNIRPKNDRLPSCFRIEEKKSVQKEDDTKTQQQHTKPGNNGFEQSDRDDSDIEQECAPLLEAFNESSDIQTQQTEQDESPPELSPMKSLTAANKDQLVKIREDPTEKKLSLKINLGALKRKSPMRHGSDTNESPAPILSSTSAQTVKKVNQLANYVPQSKLPPKKRKNAKTDDILDAKCATTSSSHTNESRDKDMEIRVILERVQNQGTHDDDTRIGTSGQNEATGVKSTFRKCIRCATWVRVELNDKVPLKMCSTCLKNRRKPLKCQRRQAGTFDVSQRTTMLTSPAKRYLKCGKFAPRNPTDQPLTSRLSYKRDAVNAALELCGSAFQLPYDIWWQAQCSKNTTTDSSRDYKHLKHNIYIDHPPMWPSSSQCNCQSSTNCEQSCLNRLTYVECTPSSCTLGENCTNRRIQKRQWCTDLQTFDTKTDRGCGVRVTNDIAAGTFLCEYVGEVVSTERLMERLETIYAQYTHHYALMLDAGYVIDSYRAGSVARLFNHSCQPNCSVQKWNVNGYHRIGIFADRQIQAGEELCYDYRFNSYDAAHDKNRECLCGAAKCRRLISNDAVLSPSVNNGNGLVKSGKPLSHRERTVASKARLFLFRNLRKLTKDSSKETSKQLSQDADCSKAIAIQTYLACHQPGRMLHPLRNTRRLAAMCDNEALARLAQVLLQLCTAVTKHLPESIEVARLRQGVLDGRYSTPKRFDLDMIQALKTAEAPMAVWHEYTAAKRRVVDQLTDVLKLNVDVDAFLHTPSAQTSPSKSNLTRTAHGDVLITTAVDLSYIDGTTKLGAHDCDNAKNIWRKLTPSDMDCVRCICGIYEEDGLMLQCDRCSYWLHSECVNQSTKSSDSKESDFVCYYCKNGSHRTPPVDVRLAEQPSDRLQNCIYYRTLKHPDKDMQVRLDECVYVKRFISPSDRAILRRFHESCVASTSGSESSTMKNTDKSTTDIDQSAVSDTTTDGYSRRDVRVFRVDRLFTGPNGERFVFGFYYARPHETFCEPTRRFHKKDLFCTPLYDTLPLSCVIARCLVLERPNYILGRPKLPHYAEDDVYVCEYRVDKAQRLFTPIKSKNNKNRYTINTSVYVFRYFDVPLKIQRDFTPFVMPNKSTIDGGVTKSSPTTSKAATNKTTDLDNENVSLESIRREMIKRKRQATQERLERLVKNITKTAQAKQ